MNNYTNKKYNTIVKYALLVVGLSLLMIVTVLKMNSIMNAVDKILAVLSPVIWGCVIAFLLNPIMKQLERFFFRFIFKKQNHKKFVRFISLSLSCILFVAIISGLLYIVIPEIINSITTIFENIAVWVEQLTGWVTKLFKNNKDIQDKLISKINTYSNDFSALFDTVKPIIENIQSGAIGFLSFVKNFLLGFIVSIYILASKERHLGQIRKIILAYFKRKTCERIFTISSQANKVFTGFIIGKIIDSAIIGVITFICMTILDMPYIIMISVIVGVTNIIPFFGPFIGAIPSALLILLSSGSLKEVIIFCVMILAIQQFDGNILGPSILGNSTGLPAIWVLISLFVGGGLFGFAGMVLAVPTCAVIYDLSKTAVSQKLRIKKLPVETEEYSGDIKHFYKPKKSSKKPLTAEELAAIEIPSCEQTNEAE